MSENNNDYVLLYHRGKNMDISDFIERNNVYNIEPKDLLELNRDLIWTQMSFFDKITQKDKDGRWLQAASDLTVDTFLPNPCSLKINPNKITAELSITQTNSQVDTDDLMAFENEKIQSILQNKGYKADGFNKRNLDCQVFGWFKSNYWFNSDGSLAKESSKFSSLGEHIISLSTNLTNNGGSFSITLPTISGKQYLNSIGKNISFIEKLKSGVLKFGDNNEYYSKSNFAELNNNYFNWLISSNDLIFMSFEKLEMEVKRKNDIDNIDIESMISEGVYDMIGLVDDVRVVTDSQNAESHVEVSGRDLMKLLIEDGSFFFNPSTTSSPSTIFGNSDSVGKHGDVTDVDMMNNTYNDPTHRLRRASNEIDIFTDRLNMNIDFIMKGVISQLANIEVVPDYVFDSWGKDRTMYNELKPKN